MPGRAGSRFCSSCNGRSFISALTNLASLSPEKRGGRLQSARDFGTDSLARIDWENKRPENRNFGGKNDCTGDTENSANEKRGWHADSMGHRSTENGLQESIAGRKLNDHSQTNKGEGYE